MTKKDFDISIPRRELDQKLDVTAPKPADDGKPEVRIMLGAIQTELRAIQSKMDGIAALIGNVPTSPMGCSKCAASTYRRTNEAGRKTASTAVHVDESAETADKPTMVHRFLTPPQVAKTLGISPGTVTGWIRRGELRAINTSCGTVHASKSILWNSIDSLNPSRQRSLSHLGCDDRHVTARW